MAGQSTEEEALRAMLTDGFVRVRELVAAVTSGLSLDVSTYRPDADANPIGWLVWHLTRIQDDHVCGLAGVDQVWKANRWHDRIGLPFAEDATGYAHSSDEVAEVSVETGLLDRYHDEVHSRCLEYVETVTFDELGRVVDESWDPPVTVSVRLVSVLGDCLQHVGQAAYLRPIAERALTKTAHQS